jgi:hypothetical protein
MSSALVTRVQEPAGTCCLPNVIAPRSRSRPLPAGCALPPTEPHDAIMLQLATAQINSAFGYVDNQLSIRIRRSCAPVRPLTPLATGVPARPSGTMGPMKVSGSPVRSLTAVSAMVALVSFGLTAAGCSSGSPLSAGGSGTTLCISLDSTRCSAPTAQLTAQFPGSETSDQLASGVSRLFKAFAVSRPPILDAVIRPDYGQHEIVVTWQNKTPAPGEVARVKSLLAAVPALTAVRQTA